MINTFGRNQPARVDVTARTSVQCEDVCIGFTSGRCAVMANLTGNTNRTGIVVIKLRTFPCGQAGMAIAAHIRRWDMFCRFSKRIAQHGQAIACVTREAITWCERDAMIKAGLWNGSPRCCSVATIAICRRFIMAA